MNSRQRSTWELLYATPTPNHLEWFRIEALLLYLGARKLEGNGSRVRFELNGVIASFHRPHPGKEAKSYQVRDARTFLERAGYAP
ncbi:type II toxin-antitoxin system HicA family toxin [Pseudomonas knackmussii]|uniref:type II toxin-antitoxin system HicA family toxin n=1 Tax=Pseudomonas knackmussii TaxID=65741 RepID=UPI003F4A6A27